MENIKFNAGIIEKGNNEKGKFVVLDKNEFYPDGKGGQLGDRGRIGKANIAFSEEKGGKVLIYVDSFPEDDVALCEINGNRRHTISSLHTAQHILSAVLEDMFKVKTVSFHMSENNCTIDVTPTISENKISIAEDAINEIVFRNLPVKKYFVNEKELSRINPRSMHEVHGKIRIVEIPGVDVSLCGGTHVDFTGEVGLIKILKIEKVKKEFLRIYFSAEKRSLGEFRNILSIAQNLSDTLTCGLEELPQKIDKMLLEIKALKKENKNFKKTILENTFNEISSRKEQFVESAVNLDKGSFMSLLSMFYREKTDRVFFIYSKNSLLLGVSKGIESNVNLQEKFSGLFENFKIKGILKDTFLFCEFSSKESFECAIKEIRQIFSIL